MPWGIVQQSLDPGQQDLVGIPGRFGRIERLGPVSPALAPISHRIAPQAQTPGDRFIADAIGSG